MSTFAKITYHIVFSTKCRTPIIQNSFEKSFMSILEEQFAQNGCLIEIGGIEDHIHILANLPTTKSISDAIRDIKANSSKWINQLPEQRNRFEWQKGYGVFSVSYSQIEAAQLYIQNQKEHHKNTTFEEEYIKFLKVHNIAFEKNICLKMRMLGDLNNQLTLV